MYFCHNPFGLGSNHKFIQHPLLHPFYHWTAWHCHLRSCHHCSSLPVRVNCNNSEPVAMRMISCVADKIWGGGMWSLRDGTWGKFFLCPFSFFLACCMDILTFFPPVMGVILTLVQQPRMIPCKPCMTVRLHCIGVLCKILMYDFVKTSWMI